MVSESDDRLATVSEGIISPVWEYKVVPKVTSPIEVLDEFLESNTHLFTLIGVFAALTIYFETTTQDIAGLNYLNNVIFTGFSLVTLLSLIVFTNVFINIHNSGRGWKSSGNFGLYLFLFFYSQISIQFAGILLQFETILNAYMFIIVFLTAETLGLLAGSLVFIIPSLIANLLPQFKKIIFTGLFSLILYLSYPVIVSLEHQQIDAPDMSRLASFSEFVQIFIPLLASFYVLMLAGCALVVYCLSAFWVLQYSWRQMKAIYHSI